MPHPLKISPANATDEIPMLTFFIPTTLHPRYAIYVHSNPRKDYIWPRDHISEIASLQNRQNEITIENAYLRNIIVI
ncbi:hypothetical protein Alches_01590 [Alicyclobacillus hesperidum subsp. aegles]|nr:hypothetical protein Alches_01590 [Alicyclobacillus hesperidum subsp. aegles]